MPGWENDPVIARVRRSLGRSVPARALPVPPAIEEPIVRLVHAEIGLAELFVASAAGPGIHAQLVHADELAATLTASLRAARVARVSLTPEKLLSNLGVVDALAAARIATMAEPAPVHIAVPYAAVAETGTVVLRGVAAGFTPSQLLLVIEPGQLVADLIDLVQRLSDDAEIRSTLMLSGTPPRISAFVLH